jgi:hypothetical protein
MADFPKFDETAQRLGPLWGQLRPAESSPPFVVEDRFARQIEVMHASAGRDATYVALTRKMDGDTSVADLAATVHYAPFVEGTAIIYDLIDETMQGKARPFMCDLTGHFLRSYLLLPFQTERTSIAAHGTGERRFVEVTFLDGCDKVVQAALPFQLRTIDSSGNVLTSKYTATNRNGQFKHELAPMSRVVVVHSGLTSREERLTL